MLTVCSHADQRWLVNNYPYTWPQRGQNLSSLSPTKRSCKNENRSIKSESEINNTILIKWKLMFCSSLPSGLNVKKPLFLPPTSVPSLTMLNLVRPEQAVLSKTQKLGDSHNHKKTGNWHTHIHCKTHTHFKRKHLEYNCIQYVCLFLLYTVL